MPRKKIIFWLLILFVFYSGILYFQKISFMKALYGNEGPDTGFFSKKYQEIDAIPENIREFYTNADSLNLKNTYRAITKDRLANGAISTIDRNPSYKESQGDFIPENYEKYKTDFCQYVLNRIEEPKKYTKRDANALNELPGSPKSSIARTTCRLWAHLSILLKNQGFEKESLLTSYAIFYMQKDLENNYQAGLSSLNRMIGAAISSCAVNELLSWAEKPHKNCAQYSKSVAKDIIELIKTEPALSDTTDLHIDIIKCEFKYLAMRGNLPSIFALLSSSFRNMTNDCKNFTKSIENKKYYEYKEDLPKQLKKLKDTIENSSRAENPITDFLQLAFLPFTNMGNEAVRTVPNVSEFAKSIENKLAKMEMVAIALAYNSFHAENNRVPTSIEELEKWFGQPLPINRLTGNPYNFNEIEGFTLYNEGVDEQNQVKNPSRCAGDDFFFRFSEN